MTLPHYILQHTHPKIHSILLRNYHFIFILKKTLSCFLIYIFTCLHISLKVTEHATQNMLLCHKHYFELQAIEEIHSYKKSSLPCPLCLKAGETFVKVSPCPSLPERTGVNHQFELYSPIPSQVATEGST